MAEIIKWWKNKWAVLIICTGILSVIIAFLFAYFISWGWILSLITAIGGGITMRVFINKLIDDFIKKQSNT
jgi:uncharacterized membrane protein YdjX (TVP38/TMEM64 family)